MMPELWKFESEAMGEGYAAICGIDEAGRGPLAGPVYAAAVILPYNTELDGLNDSKKLTAKKRDVLFDLIREKALAYCVAFADEHEIDEINILNAAMLAMRRAAEGLFLEDGAVLPPKTELLRIGVRPDMAFVDGNRDPGLGFASRTIVKGDAQSASVAAASILAKVSRDRFMDKMDAEYPEYRFAKHKGYPTALHYELLEKYGPCPIHRRSFRLSK